MKRLLISILFVLLTVCSCAPDNIKAPIQNEPPAVTPQPEQNTTVVPEQNQNTGETPDQTKPAPFVLFEKTKNEGVMPTASVQKLEFADVASLKDKTLKMFVLENSAFSAGKLTEKEWLTKLKDEIGLTVDFETCSAGTIYEKQLIASKTGKGADLITANINNIFESLPLMSAKLNIDIEETDDLPFSKNVFAKTGGKVFSGIGNAAVLWYNKNIVKDDTPFKMYEKGEWTDELLSAQLISTKNAKQALIEIKASKTPFLSTAGKQITGLEGGKILIDTDSDSAKTAAENYSKLFTQEGALCDKTQSFGRGNTAFVYAQTPAINGFSVSFAPIPATTEGAMPVSELCGTGIGISKTISEDKINDAISFAMLWSARYTESRIDYLMTTLALEGHTAKAYINLCENEAGLYVADSTAQTLLDDEFKLLNESIEKAKAKALVLNKRA